LERIFCSVVLVEVPRSDAKRLSRRIRLSSSVIWNSGWCVGASCVQIWL